MSDHCRRRPSKVRRCQLAWKVGRRRQACLDGGDKLAWTAATSLLGRRRHDKRAGDTTNGKAILSFNTGKIVAVLLLRLLFKASRLTRRLLIMSNFSILLRKGIKTWKLGFLATCQNLVKNVSFIRTRGQPNLLKRHPTLQMPLRGRPARCLTIRKICNPFATFSRRGKECYKIHR